MIKLKKYLYIRNYVYKIKWLRIFNNIANSQTGNQFRIHSSSAVKSSIIGNNVTVNKHVTILNSEVSNYCRLLSNNYIYKTNIGDYSYVNNNSTILRAKIGKFCSIASHVYIGPGSHPLDCITTHPFIFLTDHGKIISENNVGIVKKREKQSIIIGNDVWIGQGALIMNDINIGDGAIIGARTVVTKNVDPYSIIIGTPGKLYKYRYSKKIISELLKIKWWNWPRAKLIENVDKFYFPENFISEFSDSK